MNIKYIAEVAAPSLVSQRMTWAAATDGRLGKFYHLPEVVLQAGGLDNLINLVQGIAFGGDDGTSGGGAAECSV